jgi:peptidoglycan hydrolase-like protein with peptidoglycan-binding domain
VSYLFLITKDGKNVVKSYVSSDYKKSWQKDLQSQLTIAGYDVGLIDGFAGDTTKGAVELATKDGILPDADVSMRSTMLLINHNRNKDG